MKESLNLKPIIPKQMVIWNPDIVFKYFKQIMIYHENVCPKN